MILATHTEGVLVALAALRVGSLAGCLWIAAGILVVLRKRVEPKATTSTSEVQEMCAFTGEPSALAMSTGAGMMSR